MVDLTDLDAKETPQYHSHEDELQNVETLPSLDEKPHVNPKRRGRQYLNAEI